MYIPVKRLSDPVLRNEKLVFRLTQRLDAFGPFTQDCFQCIWPDLAHLSGIRDTRSLHISTNTRNHEYDYEFNINLF